jgi:hypothetical protein
LQNEQYNWSNFFIAKQEEGEIMECGNTLKDTVFSGLKKKLHLFEFFTSKKEALSKDLIEDSVDSESE